MLVDAFDTVAYVFNIGATFSKRFLGHVREKVEKHWPKINPCFFAHLCERMLMILKTTFVKPRRIIGRIPMSHQDPVHANA